MFAKIQRWLAANRSRRRAHEAAWSQSVVPGPDGLTSFQHQASEQLCAEVGAVAFQRLGQTETYLLGKLPGTEASAFIYADGAQIHAGPKALFLAEREDYATPKDLIQRFIAAARGVAT